MPDLLRWAADNWGLLLAVAAAAGGFWKFVRPAWQRLSEFLDDWGGKPERPGWDRIPGVPERLQSIEAATAAHRRALAELRPNGGSSIKDAIDRIDKRTERLGQRLDAVERVVVPNQPDGER